MEKLELATSIVLRDFGRLAKAVVDSFRIKTVQTLNDIKADTAVSQLTDADLRSAVAELSMHGILVPFTVQIVDRNSGEAVRARRTRNRNQQIRYQLDCQAAIFRLRIPLIVKAINKAAVDTGHPSPEELLVKLWQHGLVNVAGLSAEERAVVDNWLVPAEFLKKCDDGVLVRHRIELDHGENVVKEARRAGIRLKKYEWKDSGYGRAEPYAATLISFNFLKCSAGIQLTLVQQYLNDCAASSNELRQRLLTEGDVVVGTDHGSQAANNMALAAGIPFARSDGGAGTSVGSSDLPVQRRGLLFGSIDSDGVTFPDLIGNIGETRTVGGEKKPQVQVSRRQLADFQRQVLRSVVLGQLGSAAHRVYCCLLEHGYLDQKHVAELTLIPQKQCSKLIYELFQLGYVSYQELSKSIEKASSQTTYLWFARSPDFVVQNAYAAMTNLIHRLLLEQGIITEAGSNSYPKKSCNFLLYNLINLDAFVLAMEKF